MLKKRIKKLLMLIIISVLMFNFIGSNVVMADSTDLTQKSNTTTSTTTQNNAVKDLNIPDSSGLDEEMAIAEKIDYSAVGILLDGYVGYKTYEQKVLLVVVGGVLQFLATMVGESAGTIEESSGASITMVAVEDILFNKLAITDINFFNLHTFGATNKAFSDSNNPIKALKQSVATWYMTLRVISIIILLAVLVYIGIRMAISSVASEKAEYKKMFMSWVVSLALVFLLHYIILAALAINNTLVNIIADFGEGMLNDNGFHGFFTNYLSKMVINCFNPLATIGWSYTFTYVAIVALTFVFLIMYIKRMLTIAFLILIAPIITITYSIDKVGDGKAQAFSAWFKELLHNIFIQPFHCLIYLAFTSVAIEMLQHYGTIAATILVILSMAFILLSEKIIKKIFGIDSESTGNALATALVLRSAYGKLSMKKPSVPSNVVAAGAGAAAAKSNANAKAPSMGATNNMAAVSPTTGGQTTNTNNSNKYDSSEELSRKLSSGQAHANDYEDLRNGDDGSQRINERMTGGKAHVDDYDVLMGNKVENNQPQRNKVYGVLGTQPAEPKEEPKPEKSNAEKAWDMTKKGFKSFHDSQWNGGLAGAVLGATLSTVAGADVAETIGSIGVGKKAQEALQANAQILMNEKKMQWEKYLKDIDIRENDRNLASSFRDYKNGNDYNKNEDIQKTRDYLNMTKEEVQNMPDKEAQKFVQSLHATRELYANTYTDEDINEKVVETMEKIIDKEIEPVD